MLRKILFFLMLSTMAFAQGNPPLGVQDEGGTVDRPVFVIDCVGTGIACTKSGTKATLTVAGGGLSGLTAGKITKASTASTIVDSAIYEFGGSVSIGTTAILSTLTVIPSIAYTWGTGGDSITNYESGGKYYRAHTFTTLGAGTFTAPYGLGTSVQVLAVAGGGGGGGGGGSYSGGGGGAGGMIVNSSYTVTPGAGISLSVGDGGAGGLGTAAAFVKAENGTAGSDTTFGSLTAVGGGYGSGGYNEPAGGGNCGGGAGGSGGGAGSCRTSGTVTGGSSTSGQGNDGGAANYAAAGGGGGGAGSVGENYTTGTGGTGAANTYSTNSSVTYAVGGNADSSATAGTSNRGNGGYSGASTASYAGKGGSGIVVVRYEIPSLSFGLPAASIMNGTITAGKNTAGDASLSSQGVGTTSATNNLQTTNSSGTALFTINDNGNVGIGSTSPRQLLEVVGSVRATGFIADGNVGISTTSCTGFVKGLCVQ